MERNRVEVPARVARNARTVGLVALLPATMACAADAPRRPHAILAALRQSMYVVGETSGRHADLDKAERGAAMEMARAIVGDPDGVVEKSLADQTPLMAAAAAGYARVTSTLLQSPRVRASIGEVDRTGATAWTLASLALRQSAWVCNPQILDDPFMWVPLMVVQPCYVEAETNPYRRTRELLEAAGAVPDPDAARRIWQRFCTNQNDTVRARVDAASDLQGAVLAEGAAVLARLLAGRRSGIR